MRERRPCATNPPDVVVTCLVALAIADAVATEQQGPDRLGLRLSAPGASRVFARRLRRIGILGSTPFDEGEGTYEGTLIILASRELRRQQSGR